MLNRHLSSLRNSFGKKLFYLTCLTFIVGMSVVSFPPAHRVKAQSQAKGQSQTQAHICPTCSQPEQRTIYAPTIELPEAESSDIVLNCRSPHEMDAVPTFYTEEGEAIVGDAVHLQPSEIRFVTVESLIPAAERGHHVWGGMSFSYTGRLMEVWAQITLRGRGQHASSDVTFSVLNNYGADTQEAVWWMPKPGKAVIALGNSSNAPIHTALEFSNGDVQELDIAPFATAYVRRNSNNANGKTTEAGEGESVKLTTTGPAGSLKAVGYVSSISNNFTSSIRFYETPNAVQQHLFATNFRAKNSSAHLLLKNTSATSLTAAPRFLPVDGTGGAAVTLPAVTLAGGEIKELDLQPLRTAAASRSDLEQTSVRIENSGAPGSLIGALVGTNQATNVAYDVPLRDSGVLRNSTGAYPVRLDDDYKTVVSITNVGNEATQFIVVIAYDGGQYALAIRELAAGQTAVYDIKKIRDEQIPDQNGNVIPLNVTGGQFRWSITKTSPSEARLIGRSEVVSQSERVSISYSCPAACPNNGPYYASLLFDLEAGDFATADVQQSWYDSYGNEYDSAGSIPGLQSADTSIATAVMQSVGTMRVDAIDSGDTSWFSDTYHLYDYVLFRGNECDDLGGDTTSSGDIAVKPTITSITPSKAGVGSTTSITINGTGFTSTNPSITAGAGITISSIVKVSATKITADFAVAADATGGNHAVHVTVKGQQSVSNIYFFVQIPTKASAAISSIVIREPDPGDVVNGYNETIRTNVCGAYQNVTYTLLDQSGNPIHQELTVAEVLTDFMASDPGVPQPQANSETTTDQGIFVDFLGVLYSPPCSIPAFNFTEKQTFQVTVGQSVYDLTTKNTISISKSAPAQWTISLTNTTP